MKIKTWLKYFVYAFIIIAFMYLAGYASIYLKKLQEAFRTNIYQYGLITFILYAVIGFLIGLEYFLNEKDKNGTWKVNLPKLILIGLPSLYFSSYVFIFYCPVSFIRNVLIQPIEFFLRVNTNLISIFQLLFGYVVITSLYKVSEK
ncbi:hypothetical protein [Clostridium ljungdahlii]|uniref:Uncharacterized protein n=1 Tax=Clostridium ljungdahlii TaxID=1538 RepID=A0A162L883_9CLOT|nr:hypothetical protein [Clostridium ljungdahlii]OAA90026.1 hypothetical protein WY13_01615 [Clostridium ljungdahlii]